MGGASRMHAGFLICLLFVLKVSAQKMDECKKSGDYLWKKSSAQKFFFCYRVGYAMAMECQGDRFMCKKPGKVFAPCMCIGNEVSYDECGERFEAKANSYQAGGKVMKELATLAECEDYCLKTVHCLAFSFRGSDGQCLIHLPNREAAAVVQVPGITYYLKKACALKFGYKHRDVRTGGTNGLSSTTPTPGDLATDTGGRPQPTGGRGAEEPQAKEGADGYADPYGNQPYGDDTVTTQHTPRETTTTIPDSGCPYGLRKYENKSHRGGQLLKHITDVEACKNWCLQRGYCMGIDFDLVQYMCYFHKVIEDVAMSDAENVVHIRRQKCTSPLKCWSQISYNSSNVDPSTPQIPCQGVCFVREQIFNTYSVFERGCHASSPPHQVGCVVDGQLTGLTCFCDTDRCNGLSIAALASLMLHLPLDGDASDHSGLGRNGQAALGYLMPQMSCLEKAINCSMVFSGHECIEVPQMASQAWGDVNLKNEFTPLFTVSVWFKAAQRDVAEVQGITGNSVDPAVSPTWAIQTSNITSNLVTAGISTDNSLPFLPDFKYVVAKANEWHHLAMTYDSTYDPAQNIFPILQVYLDGVEVAGNMQSDMNSILVRREPVTVGCVAGKGFIGLIDDIRIFASALGPGEVQALLQMNDGLYQ